LASARLIDRSGAFFMLMVGLVKVVGGAGIEPATPGV
jgi:hypothetical protein